LGEGHPRRARATARCIAARSETVSSRAATAGSELAAS
jgi:hypothetical protein